MSEQSSAFLDGWCAHRACLPVEANPYDNQTQVMSRTRWENGWVARFSMLKHRTAREVEKADADHIE